MFQVLVSPGTVGTDSFVLQLMNGDASPLAAKEATLILSLPERGIEPLERAATLGADGYWHVRDVPLPYPGRWHIRIEALVTDFRKGHAGRRTRRAGALKGRYGTPAGFSCDRRFVTRLRLNRAVNMTGKTPEIRWL